ncbi:hypothetical protein CBR_g40301 [Chara braunii]|uniref:Integrase catalytic domain-containing protein n=1 Tax=Chara braunii TaxID=69332 RepID=A0A388K275_CHABU|nr:hypothetical protein CBR_g40301 [Chara braunii]|eukprot:GBG64053.1 hypothetical protein CBR_g40301 [Chara braunii]
MIRRRAKMQRRGADIEELETMDLTNMDDDVRVVRRALLGVIEMQEHQTTILQDIQQSLAVLAGRAQAAPSPAGPGACPVPYPPFFVPPMTGVSPYIAPSSVAIVSVGMPLSGGVTAGSSLQVPIQTVYTQTPSQVAVTTQPAVSQPVQPQGTEPQQLAQQPVSPGPQPGVVHGPGQTQWVPKTAIAAPKPFTGDKRGEDLDTWLRSVPVYVRCKLTLPHEEVLVAASYLEGSAARWLSGLVLLQGYGHDFRAWAATQKLDDFLQMVEERWHDPQEAQRATGAILTLHTRQFKSVREATEAVSQGCAMTPRHLKHALTHYEVLKLPDPDKPFIVTTDASQYGIGVVLAQPEGPKLRPVEYMSKKMPSQKLAKSTYEKELYAVYKALTHWRHYLLGRFFILKTDHQTLRWTKTQLVLFNALKRWIEVIEQYDFDPQYLKGEYNKVVDALSHRPDFSGALITEFNLTDSVTQSLVEAYRKDQFMSEIIHRLEAKYKKTSVEFELVNGLLFLEKEGNKRLCVPNSESLRSLFLGVSRCHRPFWVQEDRSKSAAAVLVAHDDARRPAVRGDLSVTSKRGMRHIFVIVDRFSKYARLVAMPEIARTEYVIKMFKENWVRDFGLPKSIISDRNVRFTSELWKAAAAEQGTQLQMTYGNHPEANGQAEQLNRVVQHLLRHYIKPNQVDWDEKLALIASFATSAMPRQQCHISSTTSATVPRQQYPATMTVSVLGMPGQLANESIAKYRQRFQAQLALIEAEEQRQAAVEAACLQAEAAETAEKQRLQAEADADTQARRKEAQDQLQRHKAASIEKLKFWHFEPSEHHKDVTPEEQHKEFIAKLVTQLVYTCNHLQSELANLRRAVQNHKDLHEDATWALDSRVQDLEQVAPRPDAGESSSAPSTCQLEERVAHVVAMLGDISSFAAPATISKQLDTLKTEVHQLHQRPNKDGNTSAQHYKMPTFRIGKFDDYTHQDPVPWWEGFTTELQILFVPEHSYIGALFLNSKGGCQIWLSHLATIHGVQVADLHKKISWDELTKLWKKRFIVDDAPALAINYLFSMTQGNTPARDWLTAWQKIVATPDLELPFSHLHQEFTTGHVRP